jgi:2-oxoglutarate ferredoxin oxidoreductase subunit gamma
MERATIIAGFGGQGLLFAGHVLALAAVAEGREVSWMPAYGPEMRGGTASCTVVVADRPIGSPIVDAAHAVLALNPPSLAKFEPLLVPGGLLVCNSSLIEAEPSRSDIEVVRVPCAVLARPGGSPELGIPPRMGSPADGRLVGIVALGALVARRPIVRPESVHDAIERLLAEHHPELVAADRAAFEAGLGASSAARAAGSPA